MTKSLRRFRHMLRLAVRAGLVDRHFAQVVWEEYRAAGRRLQARLEISRCLADDFYLAWQESLSLRRAGLYERATEEAGKPN